MRIWKFSVERWQFTLVLFGLLIAVGLNSLLNIPRSEDPEFHVPIPTVVAVYPGADPEDIERLVVDPIEDAINELDDIKRIDSRSMDGVGVVHDRVPVAHRPGRQVTTRWCARSTASAASCRRTSPRSRSARPARAWSTSCRWRW